MIAITRAGQHQAPIKAGILSISERIDTISEFLSSFAILGFYRIRTHKHDEQEEVPEISCHSHSRLPLRPAARRLPEKPESISSAAETGLGTCFLRRETLASGEGTSPGTVTRRSL